MALTTDFRSLLDARRFSREQAETLIALLQATARPTVLPWNLGPSTWTNQPAAATPLFGSAAGTRAALVDLSGYTEARITASVATGGAVGSTLRLYRALTAPMTSGSYATLGSISAPIATAGVSDSGWLSIPAASRVASYCDIWGVGGDGAADPVLGTVLLWLR